MKINSIKYNSAKNYFILKTDNKTQFFLSINTVNQYGLKKGYIIGDEEKNIFLLESQKVEAKNIVFNLINKRNYSSYQLINHLKKHNIDDNIIDITINFFLDKGYIDDQAYLEMAVKDGINIKGFGAIRIASDLYSKGFNRSEVFNVYEKLSSKDMEYENAKKFADKNWSNIRGNDIYHRKRKMSDRLYRRGFTYDIIKKVLNGLKE